MFRLLSLVILCFVFNPAHSKTLLILGDSLSAGYQMPIEQAWPSLLTDDLANNGQHVTVINASVSGDTTGNGLSRLPSLLEQHQPEYVLIELGANDGLRGFPIGIVQNNIQKMVDLIRKSEATPILMQIHILPNYGKRYTEAFADVYPELSKTLNVPLMPFFLEGVIINPDWMMNDGLHPKPVAQPWISQFVANELINHF